MHVHVITLHELYMMNRAHVCMACTSNACRRAIRASLPRACIWIYLDIHLYRVNDLRSYRTQKGLIYVYTTYMYIYKSEVKQNEIRKRCLLAAAKRNLHFEFLLSVTLQSIHPLS